MSEILEIYDTEILLVENQYGDVLELVGSAIIVVQGSGGGAVASVNGKTGAVVLTPADVGSDVSGAALAVKNELQPQINTINQTIPNLATQQYVLTQLIPKASVVYVDAGLAGKADALATSQALATKATVTALNQVKTLAETNQLNISTKAAQTDLDSTNAQVETNRLAVLTKADITALANLAFLVDTKADPAYVQQQIALLVGSAPPALNTIYELAAALQNEQGLIDALDQSVANRVRFDVATQALTALQKSNARTNIGAEETGKAAMLIAQITAASIGAATAAQGTKADSAIQSGDLAPVALSGSFGDLINKSGLFNLVYSAYALGTNTVIAATDTLGQMLGKIQGQISANTTAVATKADAANTLAAINTKEPTITAGTTAQYWRGDKTWRDFATDVRATLLTGISFTTNRAVVATDSVLVAIGLLQAQISAGQPVNWVAAASCLEFTAANILVNNLYFAKINGFLAVKGYISTNIVGGAVVNAGNPIFRLKPAWSIYCAGTSSAASNRKTHCWVNGNYQSVYPMNNNAPNTGNTTIVTDQAIAGLGDLIYFSNGALGELITP